MDEKWSIHRFLPPSFPKYIPKYTILISVRATVGKINLTQEKSWFNNNIIAILANEEIVLKKYLYYYFLTQQDKIKNLAKYFRCTIFASLPPKLFKNWLIPVPDLATQAQIVAKLDKFMSLDLECSRLATAYARFIIR